MSHDTDVIFKATTLRPVIQEAIDNHCQLLLVKDDGLYFMSEDGSLSPETKRRQVAYAEGFNPAIVAFDDWYDRLREICGGDDFGEVISPDDAVMQAVLKYHANLRVSFTETSLTITAVTL